MENISDIFEERMQTEDAKQAQGLFLNDGSRVGVVGGGPAGSMFSYFLLRMAETVGLELEVDILEPRNFSFKGPAGCNHCGGVVSESLVQRLATEGINLPTGVVQRGIDSYTLHMDVGTVRIETPTHEKRIAAVYRGNGPRQSEPIGYTSFDGYLQELAAETGANVIHKLVTGLERTDNGINLTYADGISKDYDLVAVATGVNSQFHQKILGKQPSLASPETVRTFITELQLGQDVIEKYLGSSMHVFLLDLPRLEFAALIPKGDFVTMCLLGHELDDKLIESFCNAPEVRRCFPLGQLPPHACHCFPRINVQAAAPMFDDRLVMIGDSGVARLYKDGIGSAYRTAKAAARTAVFHGISKRDFHKYFRPTSQRIVNDNSIGKLIFMFSHQMQRLRFSRRALHRMTAKEQQKKAGTRHMSQVLWDVFTGSAPYREVLVNAMHPGFITGLLWNLVAANLIPGKKTESQPPSASPDWHLSLIHPQQLQKLPPCQANCPNGTDVRGWIAGIAQHEEMGISLEQAYQQAWEKIVTVNPFPATLGRICPHPCESECNRTGKDGAVAVNEMERFIGDWALERKLRLPEPTATRQQESFGVIGAGPAGLSFAYQMARRGYPVTVYDRFPRPGGMLANGIPNFRLPQAVIDAEAKRIADVGVKFVLNTEVGKDMTVQDIRARHDILFLGIGAQQARRLNIPGEEGPGVWSGIEFLERLKQGDPLEIGHHVTIIGGGNTAIDTARAARRQGAEVTLLYRRTREEMPAINQEVDEMLAEGIRLEYLSAPKAINRQDGKVQSVVVQKMQLGEHDHTGRRRSIPSTEPDYELRTDSVLVAVSQGPDWSGLENLYTGENWINTTEYGWVADDVWAGGDDRGLGIAVLAVAQGRQAAEAVHADLRGDAAPSRDNRPLVTTGAVKPSLYESRTRTGGIHRPVEQWLDNPELEVSETISEDEFLNEAGRCLSCGSCLGCQQCWMYCNASGFLRVEKAQPGAYFALSLDRCEGCGKCVEVCPCGFLSPVEGQATEVNLTSIH